MVAYREDQLRNMRTDLIRACLRCRIRTHTGILRCPGCARKLSDTSHIRLERQSTLYDFQKSGNAGREPLEGYILSKGALRGPLTGLSCVGFGLSGTAGRHMIHDSRVLPFELEVDGGVLSVDPDVAVLERMVDPPRQVEANPDDDLARFLDERGVFAVPLDLAELLLREGDPVVVEGDLARRDVSEAHRRYRRSAVERCLVGDAERPLVIRVLA